MNHSSFIDLEMIESMVYPKPLNIICTTDGFIGKNWLMREIGCIPTKKFTVDTQLVKKMISTIKKLKSSILLYPEAGYSIDGTSTTLPTNLGKLVKMLKVPVITVISEGAYHRQPLYNELIKRDVKVKANVNLLINKDEIENKKKMKFNK
jgi:1-acyl-sn-glycerol-3-phosphate acyltransferase